MTSKVADSVRELLTYRVNTFEKLEIVMGLYRAERSTSTLNELSRSLGVPMRTVEETVRELRAVSLIDMTSTGEVHLLPPTSRDRAAVEALATAYEEDRFAVVKEMGEIAMRRIRSMAANVFADAFVIRKKTPKDGNDG